EQREMRNVLGYEYGGEARDGLTAIELAKRHRPDLLIMDIQMPEVDGIAAAEELTRERIAPVVLLTAFSDQVLVERAREAGVVGYVVKPFREAELMPVIELSRARCEEFRTLEMEVHGMRESEAFHRIRKTSMDARKSMKEVSEAILLAHEMDSSISSEESRSSERVEE